MKAKVSRVFGAAADWPELKFTLNELFDAQVAKTPKNIAVFDGISQESLTYEELDEKATIVAAWLQNVAGLKPDQCVGILMNRCMEYVIAYTAILKAGGAYMPMDIVSPIETIQRVINDATPVAILTKQDYLAKINLSTTKNAIAVDSSWDELSSAAGPYKKPTITLDNLAYFVYSSGTTGVPKGISCPHRGAVNSYVWRYKHTPFLENDREACNIFFVWELFRPLLQGYPTYIIPDNVIYDPGALIEYISKHKITRILLTPSLFQAVLGYPHKDLADALKSLRLIWLCGEVVTVALMKQSWEKLGSGKIKILNLYSVSECHDVAIGDLSTNTALNAYEEFAPCGKIMENVETYILDENKAVVPYGEVGELYVGGPTLARGYVNLPEKTAERFVQSPFTTDTTVKLYKTGDVAQFNPSDGLLIVRGRCDSMVKIRGYSIELGAVEAALQDHPSVTSAVALPWGDGYQTKRLAAFLVLKPDTAVTALGKKLREFLKDKLPHYMIPNVMVHLDSIPLHKISGKLDKKALPNPDLSPRRLQLGEYAPAASAEEKLVLQVWKDVLAYPPDTKIGIHDDFFDLGGNSLQIAQVYARLQPLTGFAKITLSQLYECSTISSLITLCNKSEADATSSPAATSAFLHKQVDISFLEKIRDAGKLCVVPYNAAKKTGRHYFLTGATGFLGAFILRDLLEAQTDAIVTCLVRSKRGAGGALRRVQQNLEFYRIWKVEYTQRVRVVAGTLESAHFALDEKEWDQLAQDVDAIIHSAAAVDFVRPYDELAGVNVTGTATIVELSLTHKTKALTYISTSGVFPQTTRLCKETVTTPANCGDLHDGYAQTKWVAEQIVIKSKNEIQSLKKTKKTADKKTSEEEEEEQVIIYPVTVLRPGDIIGDSATGACNGNHDFTMFLQAYADLKCAPYDRRQVEMTPVDWISAVAVADAVEGKEEAAQNDLKIIHCVNSQTVSMREIVAWMRNYCGYAITSLPLEQFLVRLRKRAEDDSATPILGLLALTPLIPGIVDHPDQIFDSSTSKVFPLERCRKLRPFAVLDRMIRFLLSHGKITPPQENYLYDHVAFVTGASSGIGAAIARGLATRGCHVVMAARRFERLVALREKIEADQFESSNGRIEIMQLDVTDRDAFKKCVAATSALFGTPIDILVNNAGIMPCNFMKNCFEGEWNSTIDVNVKGVLNGIGAVLPEMLARGRGDIVAISSSAGRRVFEGLAVYSGSKFCVEAVMQGLRMETYGKGIRVVSIQPGDVSTELLQHSSDAEGLKSVSDLIHAAPQLLDPSDIANSVVYALNQPVHVGVHEILIEPTGNSS